MYLPVFSFQLFCFWFLYCCFLLFYNRQFQNFDLFSHRAVAPGAFFVGEYILKFKGYLDSHRLASLPMDGQHRFVYESRFGVSRVTAAGTWMKLWAHCGGRGAALRTDIVACPVDMPFIRYTTELHYVTRLTAIMACYENLRDEDFTTHSLNYISLLHPFDGHYLLTNFD